MSSWPASIVCLACLCLTVACGDPPIPTDPDGGSSTGQQPPLTEEGDSDDTASDDDGPGTSGGPPSTGTDPGMTSVLPDPTTTGDTDPTEGDPDGDGDGYPASIDCNDDDPSIHPGADERCNLIDDDCDRFTYDEDVVSVDGEGSYATIAEAMAVASPGSEIEICRGTYAEHVVITDDLSLVGLSGSDETAIASDPAGPVVQILGGVVSLTGLSLTGGSSMGQGGGLSILGTDPVTIDDCAFTGNTSSDGAGVYAGEGTIVEMTQSFIVGNLGEIGGGMAFYGAGLVMTDCQISSNDGTETGGGLFVATAGTVELVDTFIDDNTALDGGGLTIVDSTVTLSGCWVEDNLATGVGGGAWLAGSTPSLVSINSDWDEGVSDNAPDDVHAGGLSYASYGAGASFTCDATGCM